MKRSLIILALALACLGLVGPAVAKGNPKDADGNHGPRGNTPYSNQYDAEGENVRECGDEDGEQTIDYVGATNLWPPNHKAVPGQVIAAETSSNEGPPTIYVTGTSNDSFEEGDFSSPNDSAANAAADASDGAEDGKATATLEVLRERTGQAKDGRTYTITATAMFSDGSTCTEQFTVCVPHDMRKENRQNGCRTAA